jgi:hypothetical protein
VAAHKGMIYNSARPISHGWQSLLLSFVIIYTDKLRDSQYHKHRISGCCKRLNYFVAYLGECPSSAYSINKKVKWHSLLQSSSSLGNGLHRLDVHAVGTDHSGIGKPVCKAGACRRY